MLDEARKFWDRAADDWKIQVGSQGDRNRYLCSDPVLWAFAGDVAGKKVLDAGSGTGYLSAQLAEQGAHVTGVDFSENMVAIARRDFPGIEFRVDSCTELITCRDGEFDLLVSNYVLMDVPDLEGTVRAFHRVLKPGGAAVLIFSHPCFPAGAASVSRDSIRYHWHHNYFERRKRVDPPWKHFTTEFIWFHRPLSDYWKSFTTAGFAVTGFEEPRLTEDRAHLATNEKERRSHQKRPYSVAFRLRKPE
ncbi:MAG: hypothetical protein RL328_2044 [Acidobacteriota bacterium]